MVAGERAQTAAVVDGSHDAIVRQTSDGHVLAWNAAGERLLLGWRSFDVLQHNLLEPSVHTERREEALQALARVQQGQDKALFGTMRLGCKGHPVAASLSPVLGRGGAVTGAATTMRDVREQHAVCRRIELANASLVATLQQLRRSEAGVRQTAELLEQLFESVPDLIWPTDAKGRWAVMNSTAAAVIGRPRESLIVGRPQDIVAAVASLASDEAAFVQSAALRVDSRRLDRLWAGAADSCGSNLKVSHQARSDEGHL